MVLLLILIYGLFVRQLNVTRSQMEIAEIIDLISAFITTQHTLSIFILFIAVCNLVGKVLGAGGGDGKESESKNVFLETQLPMKDNAASFLLSVLIDKCLLT